MTKLEHASGFSDLPILIDVALDCGTMDAQQLLGLRPGGVVRSTRAAGDNVDILASGRVIGSGEIVALEGVMGVRITNLKEST